MHRAISGRTSHPAERSPSTMDLAQLVKAGMVHGAAKHFAQAREIFTRVRVLWPAQPHGELGLGSVCFSEGQFEAAIGHYRAALKLSPCNAYAYALLGESQIFQLEHSAARVSLRRACEIDPNGPYGRLARHLLLFLQSVPAHECERQDCQL